MAAKSAYCAAVTPYLPRSTASVTISSLLIPLAV